MATLKTKIVLRNDLAAQWQQYNPILLAGEAGVEIDTGLFKIGDGVTAWNNLAYANNQISTDEKTITKNAENGALTLNNWQKKYYKWDATSNSYVETAGWISGLEPRAAADGTLAWYEPNTSTITGLESAIAALQEQDNLHTEAIDLLSDESKNYLTKEGGALTGNLVLADGHKAASEQVVDTKIASAIQGAGHLKREIVAALPTIEDADPDTIYMIKSGTTTSGDLYSEWMIVNGVFEQIGDTSVDLSNYLQKVEGAILGNIAALDASGALTDSGIAAQAIKEHLENEEIHISKKERALWNEASTLASENASSIAALTASVETQKYVIFSKPVGASVRYSDKEIRVMVPADYIWEKQSVGATGNANMYYMGFRAYAPANAATFKEGDNGTIIDEVLDFTGDFAGIDAYGRKYSIVWYPLASYDESTDTWIYFGAQSSTQRYVGWTYVVEWYDKDNVLISSDSIRISLSNESCHENVLPYFMGNVVKNVSVNGTLLETVNNTVSITTSNFIKSSDEITVNEDNSLSINTISTSKLIQDEDERLVLNGGGAAL